MAANDNSLRLTLIRVCLSEREKALHLHIGSIFSVDVIEVSIKIFVRREHVFCVCVADYEQINSMCVGLMCLCM